MASMFELLMELPLFRGVSHQRLSKTVGESKFHFLKYPAGETIIRAGDPCTHITFVISGSVRSTIENENGRFAVSQTLKAPSMITPEFLFGRSTLYPCTVEARESTGILQIDKRDYLTILYSDQVFMFNYLNTLAANAQKSMQGILSLTTGDIDERIAFWISALSQPDGTDISLTCSKRDLCSLFGVQRATFENAIERLKEAGIVSFSDNKELRIADRNALIQLLRHNHEEPATPSEDQYGK